jgi:hypothetical protein
MMPFLASAPTAHSHLCVCVPPFRQLGFEVYHSSQSTRSFEKEREKSFKFMGYQSPILEKGENFNLGKERSC